MGLLVLVRRAETRVSFGCELIGEVREGATAHERAAEPRRVEAFDRADHELVRIDPAAAVDVAARVGLLELCCRVLPLGVLIAQRVREVLVEGAVPRALNHPAARRVVAARGQREAGVAADLVNGLHERLSERRFADDQGAVVILQRAGHDLGRAGAVAIDEHDHRQVRVLAVFAARGSLRPTSGCGRACRRSCRLSEGTDWRS